jgi:uncharacterized protein
LILYRHIQIIIIKFDWNDEKAELNLKNHGVSFDEASEVFFDPNLIEGFDSEHSKDEARFYIIGFSSRRLLYVVFAERLDGEIIRIISARKAEQKKENEYKHRK